MVAHELACEGRFPCLDQLLTDIGGIADDDVKSAVAHDIRKCGMPIEGGVGVEGWIVDHRIADANIGLQGRV